MTQPSLLSRDQIQTALQNYNGKDKQRITDLMKKESAKLVEDYDAFGFPWMVIERSDGDIQSFFGSDRFSNIAWW
jgi:glutathione S-transferase kappa 1